MNFDSLKGTYPEMCARNFTISDFFEPRTTVRSPCVIGSFVCAVHIAADR
jgi:hypothetical protein